MAVSYSQLIRWLVHRRVCVSENCLCNNRCRVDGIIGMMQFFNAWMEYEIILLRELWSLTTNTVVSRFGDLQILESLANCLHRQLIDFFTFLLVYWYLFHGHFSTSVSVWTYECGFKFYLWRMWLYSVHAYRQSLVFFIIKSPASFGGRAKIGFCNIWSSPT